MARDRVRWRLNHSPDADDEICHRRQSRVMTEDEMFRYEEQFYKTDGFDMYPTPGFTLEGLIKPLNMSYRAGTEYCRCKIISQRAIDEFHRRKQLRTFFKFVTVLKAMGEFCAFCRCYVTFEAKDVADGGKTKIYRTLARWRRPPIDNFNFSILSFRSITRRRKRKGIKLFIFALLLNWKRS